MDQDLRVLLSSQTVEWYTPEWLLDIVRDFYQKDIDLDPASNEYANTIVKAKHIYTKEDDGLTKDWFGSVFVNPPYGKTGNKSNQDLWTEKAVKEYLSSNIKEAIILVKAVPGYDWFDRWFYTLPTVLIRGLVSFYNESGDYNTTRKAKAGTALFYVGDACREFLNAFVAQGHMGIYVEKLDKDFLTEMIY